MLPKQRKMNFSNGMREEIVQIRSLLEEKTTTEEICDAVFEHEPIFNQHTIEVMGNEQKKIEQNGKEKQNESKKGKKEQEEERKKKRIYQKLKEEERNKEQNTDKTEIEEKKENEKEIEKSQVLEKLKKQKNQVGVQEIDRNKSKKNNGNKEKLNYKMKGTEIMSNNIVKQGNNFTDDEKWDECDEVEGKKQDDSCQKNKILRDEKIKRENKVAIGEEIKFYEAVEEKESTEKKKDMQKLKDEEVEVATKNEEKNQNKFVKKIFYKVDRRTRRFLWLRNQYLKAQLHHLMYGCAYSCNNYNLNNNCVNLHNNISCKQNLHNQCNVACPYSSPIPFVNIDSEADEIFCNDIDCSICNHNYSLSLNDSINDFVNDSESNSDNVFNNGVNIFNSKPTNYSTSYHLQPTISTVSSIHTENPLHSFYNKINFFNANNNINNGKNSVITDPAVPAHSFFPRITTSGSTDKSGSSNDANNNKANNSNFNVKSSSNIADSNNMRNCKSVTENVECSNANLNTTRDSIHSANSSKCDYNIALKVNGLDSSDLSSCNISINNKSTTKIEESKIQNNCRCCSFTPYNGSGYAQVSPLYIFLQNFLKVNTKDEIAYLERAIVENQLDMYKPLKIDKLTFYPPFSSNFLKQLFNRMIYKNFIVTHENTIFFYNGVSKSLEKIHSDIMLQGKETEQEEKVVDSLNEGNDDMLQEELNLEEETKEINSIQKVSYFRDSNEIEVADDDPTQYRHDRKSEEVEIKAVDEKLHTNVNKYIESKKSGIEEKEDKKNVAVCRFNNAHHIKVKKKQDEKFDKSEEKIQINSTNDCKALLHSMLFSKWQNNFYMLHEAEEYNKEEKIKQKDSYNKTEEKEEEKLKQLALKAFKKLEHRTRRGLWKVKEALITEMLREETRKIYTQANINNNENSEEQLNNNNNELSTKYSLHKKSRERNSFVSSSSQYKHSNYTSSSSYQQCCCRCCYYKQNINKNLQFSSFNDFNNVSLLSLDQKKQLNKHKSNKERVIYLTMSKAGESEKVKEALYHVNRKLRKIFKAVMFFPHIFEVYDNKRGGKGLILPTDLSYADTTMNNCNSEINNACNKSIHDLYAGKEAYYTKLFKRKSLDTYIILKNSYLKNINRKEREFELIMDKDITKDDKGTKKLNACELNSIGSLNNNEKIETSNFLEKNRSRKSSEEEKNLSDGEEIILKSENTSQSFQTTLKSFVDDLKNIDDKDKYIILLQKDHTHKKSNNTGEENKNDWNSNQEKNEVMHKKINENGDICEIKKDCNYYFKKFNGGLNKANDSIDFTFSDKHISSLLVEKKNDDNNVACNDVGVERKEKKSFNGKKEHDDDEQRQLHNQICCDNGNKKKRKDDAWSSVGYAEKNNIKTEVDNEENKSSKNWKIRMNVLNLIKKSYNK